MHFIISIILTLCFFAPEPEVIKREATIFSDPIIHLQRTKPISPLEALKYVEIATIQPIGPTPPSMRPAIGDNTYVAGQCTWYAKSKRPDLPNNLGNASTWAVRAQAQGWDVSSTPRVGAIAQESYSAGGLGHVMYVEEVRGDTVILSEMNYEGPYIRSTRAVPASTYTYIY